jgi:hypothetical protein
MGKDRIVFYSDVAGRALLDDYYICLIGFDPTTERIRRWIE